MPWHKIPRDKRKEVGRYASNTLNISYSLFLDDDDDDGDKNIILGFHIMKISEEKTNLIIIKELYSEIEL